MFSQIKRALLTAVLIVALLALLGVQQAESKKLLKLAAAAAIIRGGPIIPLPVRYPVHVPKPHVKYVHSAPVVKVVEQHGWEQGGWNHAGWEGGHAAAWW